MGHICYYATEGDEKVVFTGDTLFIGGAGRFFEGSPGDMLLSLSAKLAKLPPETLVYCGHEVLKCHELTACRVCDLTWCWGVLCEMEDCRAE